jgi:hypothetical protein
MERGMRLLIGLLAGLGAGAALGLSAPALNLGFAVNAWPLAPAGTTLQRVDRTHKGDRLDVPMTRVGKQPVSTPKVLIGCEPVSSPLAGTMRASIPGRCAA